jgi:NADP-dependent aldehyde dehydrogenase
MPETYFALNPATGERLPGEYPIATRADVERACQIANAPSTWASLSNGATRAQKLRDAAAAIEALGDELIEMAHLESGLPLARLTGERARTCGQLRAFADHLESSGILDPLSLPGNPDRAPLPLPSLRLEKHPIGVIAVFGASNFPLAFSVAGGDTASALAAGCPVVVKIHPLHPGTSEMVFGALSSAFGDAVQRVHGGAEVGEWLVIDPNVAAVGFTGSQRAGLALFRLGANRPVPIPVFAEMGSVNPVFALPPGQTEANAAGYVASLTLGAGQFCTNPGLLVGVDSPGFSQFVSEVSRLVSASGEATMLSAGIAAAYEAGICRLSSTQGVRLLAEGPQARLYGSTPSVGAELFEEVFGPCGVVVTCRDEAEMLDFASSMPGQLTATLLGATAGHPLVPVLKRRVGRVVFDGFPTGVEVSPAMVHGGPFPATTDSRFSSVGMTAIERWLRPVCIQNEPSGTR